MSKYTDKGLCFSLLQKQITNMQRRKIGRYPMCWTVTYIGLYSKTVLCKWRDNKVNREKCK